MGRELCERPISQFNFDIRTFFFRYPFTKIQVATPALATSAFNASLSLRIAIFAESGAASMPESSWLELYSYALGWRYTAMQ